MRLTITIKSVIQQPVSSHLEENPLNKIAGDKLHPSVVVAGKPCPAACPCAHMRSGRVNRPHTRGEMMIHAVTGSADHCGPCALSALTGLSSGRLADKSIDVAEAFEVLRGYKGFGDVTHHDLYGRRLRSLREQGCWALSVTWPQRMGESEEFHVVAVEAKGWKKIT